MKAPPLACSAICYPGIDLEVDTCLDRLKAKADTIRLGSLQDILSIPGQEAPLPAGPVVLWPASDQDPLLAEAMARRQGLDVRALYDCEGRQLAGEPREAELVCIWCPNFLVEPRTRLMSLSRIIGERRWSLPVFVARSREQARPVRLRGAPCLH